MTNDAKDKALFLLKLSEQEPHNNVFRDMLETIKHRWESSVDEIGRCLMNSFESSCNLKRVLRLWNADFMIALKDLLHTIAPRVWREDSPYCGGFAKWRGNDEFKQAWGDGAEVAHIYFCLEVFRMCQQKKFCFPTAMDMVHHLRSSTQKSVRGLLSEEERRTYVREAREWKERQERLGSYWEEVVARPESISIMREHMMHMSVVRCFVKKVTKGAMRDPVCRIDGKCMTWEEIVMHVGEDPAMRGKSAWKKADRMRVLAREHGVKPPNKVWSDEETHELIDLVMKTQTGPGFWCEVFAQWKATNRTCTTYSPTQLRERYRSLHNNITGKARARHDLVLKEEQIEFIRSHYESLSWHKQKNSTPVPIDLYHHMESKLPRGHVEWNDIITIVEGEPALQGANVFRKVQCMKKLAQRHGVKAPPITDEWTEADTRDLIRLVMQTPDSICFWEDIFNQWKMIRKDTTVYSPDQLQNRYRMLHGNVMLKTRRQADLVLPQEEIDFIRSHPLVHSRCRTPEGDTDAKPLQQAKSRYGVLSEEARLGQLKEYVRQERQWHAHDPSYVVLRPTEDSYNMNYRREKFGKNPSWWKVDQFFKEAELEQRLSYWINNLVSFAQGKNGAEKSEYFQKQCAGLLKKVGQVLQYEEDDWWSLEKYLKPPPGGISDENTNPKPTGPEVISVRNEILLPTKSGRARTRPSWLEDTVILRPNRQPRVD